MSLISQKFSLRSDPHSLVSAISGLKASSSSAEPSDKPGPSIPLFDFLRIASTSGLRQYSQDIAEEGLVAAKLGDGANYVVDKVTDPEGMVLVVKHVKATLLLDGGAEDGEDTSRIRKVLHEIKIATHPALKGNVNILQMLGFGWELSEGSLTTPFLVVEFAEAGTLRDYLQNSPQTIDGGTKRTLALHAARALQCLHVHLIAHGDLKLENALVSMTSTGPLLKLTDFGLSTVLDDNKEMIEYWGTLGYRPPEVYEQVGHAPLAGLIARPAYRACDIYAYGLLLLEVLIDGKAYFDDSRGEIGDQSQALRCLAGTYNDGDGALDGIKELAEKCLTGRPGSRPRIEEVLSHYGEQETESESESMPLTFAEFDASAEVGSILPVDQVLASLVGSEIEAGSTHLAPWGVQETIAKGLRQGACHRGCRVASRASLELMMCHFLGFGVERDRHKVLEYCDRAAANGSFQAHRLRPHLYGAFDEHIRPLAHIVELGLEDAQKLQRVLEAEAQDGDGNVNAFELFTEVAKKQMRARMDGHILGLHQAAYLGDIPRLQELLKDHPDFRDDNGRTALFCAAQGGNFEAIKILLQIGGGDPSLANEEGHTVLHMLVMLSAAEVSDALSLIMQSSTALDLNCFSPSVLEAPEHWCELWGAPLHWAVLAGNREMTSCLVSEGARVHGWPEDCCPVRIAASLHLSEILEVLLSTIPSEPSLQGSNPFFALNASSPFRRLLLHESNVALS